MQMSEWINRYFLVDMQEYNLKLPIIPNFCGGNHPGVLKIIDMAI